MTPPALVVLAAGHSTRYGRLKQLDPVGPSGEALMDYGIHDAWRAGVRRVIMVVRAEIERDVMQHVRDLVGGAMDVTAVLQTVDHLPAGCSAPAERTKPWGTAHALWCCRDALGSDSFVTMNADDAYGRAAFERLAAWARAAPADEFAIVPFRLDTTLSPNGGVSRGVCRFDEAGNFRGIEEVLDIRRTPGDPPSSRAMLGRSTGGGTVRLRDSELCSTNLWGFTPAAHAIIEQGLSDFLGRHGDDSSAEYRVPDMIRTGLETGRITVRVLEEGDAFIGMTHPGDRDAVVAALARQVETGDCPAALGPAFRQAHP